MGKVQYLKGICETLEMKMDKEEALRDTEIIAYTLAVLALQRLQ